MKLKEKLAGMKNAELCSLILEIAKLRKDNFEWLEAKLKGGEGIVILWRISKRKS